MAKDINSIIKDLVDAIKGETSADPVLSQEKIKETQSRSQMSYEDLIKVLDQQEIKTNKINQNIQTAKNITDELIDSEQIINDLKQERLSSMKTEFQQNQLTYLELQKQYQLIEDKNSQIAKDLKKRIDLIYEQIELQAKEIENLEKEKQLKEGILSIGKEIWQVSKQYGSELEKHIIAISKSNGAYAGLLGNLREAGRLSQAATLGTGITGAENMRALESLSEGFIGLTTYSAQSISNMQVATAQLTKVGISSASAAKGFDSLVMAMGKTPEQAAKIQESFVQMAAKNRLALSAVSQAFADNSSRFIGYGEQMNKVLEGLAEQSLKTGIAIGKLVAITQQFDTFEGAAKAVGNLNALLGGDYFNSIELLAASDEERIKLLKDGIAASGIQFESMNRFEKMAIANAVGITDLNEAQKLFGQTSLQNTRQQAEQAEVQKTLAEQANLMSPMIDKLKSSFNGLYIAIDPFLSVAITLVEVFGKILNFIVTGGGLFDAFGTKIMAVLVSVGLGIGLLAIKNKVLGASWNYIANSIANATARLAAWKAANAAGAPASITSAASAATSPASSATSGLLSNAGNMLKAAGAILIFSAALFVLAKALQELSSPSITKEGLILAAFSIGALIAISFGLQKASPSITSGSIVLILLAGSLLILAMALKQFSGVDWKLVAGIGAIILGLGLAIAGFGMAVSGPQAVLIGLGIGIILTIATALYALGNSLEKISTSFKTLSQLKNIGELSSNLISFLDELADTNIEPINNLANAIGLLAENLQKLASISANMNIKGNVTATTTQNIQTLANQAGEAAVAIGETATAKQQALIPAQQTTAFVPLIVQINGKNIIDVLRRDIEIISGEQTLRMMDSVGIARSSDYIQSSPVVIEG